MHEAKLQDQIDFDWNVLQIIATFHLSVCSSQMYIIRRRRFENFPVKKPFYYNLVWPSIKHKNQFYFAPPLVYILCVIAQQFLNVICVHRACDNVSISAIFWILSGWFSIWWVTSRLTSVALFSVRPTIGLRTHWEPERSSHSRPALTLSYRASYQWSYLLRTIVEVISSQSVSIRYK